MPRTYKPKNLVKYNQQSLINAVKAVKDNHMSQRVAAQQFGINRSTLKLHLKNESISFQSGGITALPTASELELANCLSCMAKWGFGFSREEVKVLVTKFVKENKDKDTELGKHLQKYCKFSHDIPGTDWLLAFMSRHRLSVKLPSTLEKVRMTATSDPFIIYEFYDILEAEISILEIANKPSAIWNLDETGFSTAAVQTKIVAPIGKKAARVNATSGRDSMTVLASISANGDIFPPLVIFSGKKLQSTWKGANAYPGTTYSVSDSGWMTADIFASWFQNFCATIKTRPLLVVYDGHASHMSLQVIQLARSQRVSIIKLPPHTTDKLQPLDVCCFRSLKSGWDKKLAQWNRLHGARAVSKSEFVDLVGEIYPQCLTKQTITSAFQKTGIYPPNRNSYPVERFDPALLASYKSQHSNGDDIVLLEPMPTCSINADNSLPSCSTQHNLSFEQILANTFHGNHQRIIKPRRNIDSHSRVITDEEFAKLIDEKEKQKAKLTKRKVQIEQVVLKKKRVMPKRRKVQAFQDEDEQEVDGKKDEEDAVDDDKDEEDAVDNDKDEEDAVDDDKDEEDAVDDDKDEEDAVDDDKDEEDAVDDDNDEEEILDDSGEKVNGDCDEDNNDENKNISDHQLTVLHSNLLRIQMDVQEGSYYAIYFDKSYYIGRVIKKMGNMITVKYLYKDKLKRNYNWPNTDDIEDVNIKFVFFGPVEIVGTIPFHINEIEISFRYRELKHYWSALESSENINRTILSDCNSLT